MAGKKPTRKETSARRARIAEGMRKWLDQRRARAMERRRLEEKARLLVGDDSGGHGVTVEMRRISAQARERIPEAVSVHHGPNRAQRRDQARRTGRGWQARVPPGRNKPFYAPVDPEGDSDA